MLKHITHLDVMKHIKHESYHSVSSDVNIMFILGNIFSFHNAYLEYSKVCAIISQIFSVTQQCV